MKKQVLFAITMPVFFASLLFISILGNTAPTFAAEDGKVVFLKYKCNNCHSVSTADITAKNKKTKAPDLVNVTVRHEKPWIRKFIRKQEGHVSCPKVDSSRDGKLHVAEFKGTQAEEDTLIEWLDQQRAKE